MNSNFETLTTFLAKLKGENEPNDELYGWIAYIIIVVVMVGTGLALDRWYCQKQKAIYESNDNYLIR